ncbi:MAG: J domain-containing protein, partial [Candidatus Hydrogenedentes bacterium]|nr:J domain-containing protein [Candidatus Hydrogenedentota bacterium]
IRQLRGERVEDDTPPPSDREVDLCYKLLGLSPSSSWDQVEKAYRAKAKLHHPDHGGDDDTMRALNEAYALLKRMKKSSPRRQ